MGVVYAPSMLDRILEKGARERCLGEFHLLPAYLDGASALLHGSVVTGYHY